MAKTILLLRPHLRNVPPVGTLEPPYTLRRLKHDDEPELVRLLSLVFEETWDEAKVQNELTRAEGVRAVYGIFSGEALVATASSQTRPDLDSDAGFVHWVATHPEHRGKGLAAALLRRVLEDFRERSDLRARLATQPERLRRFARIYASALCRSTILAARTTGPFGRRFFRSWRQGGVNSPNLPQGRGLIS